MCVSFHSVVQSSQKRMRPNDKHMGSLSLEPTQAVPAADTNVMLQQGLDAGRSQERLLRRFLRVQTIHPNALKVGPPFDG